MRKIPLRFTLDSLDKNYFDKNGYIVVQILCEQEISIFQDFASSLLKNIIKGEKLLDKTGAMRFNLFGDVIDLSSLYSLVYNPTLLKVAEKLLDKNLILEGALFLLSTIENNYKQGWHRDVWQIPENQIDERMFSPTYQHNCIQLNLAIWDDQSFWIVPESHQRPDTMAERKLFSGSKHLTPVDAQMPNNLCIKIQAGQAIFYNNNAIHRGYNSLKKQRATFHASYHSSLKAPTWHFYNPGFGTLPLRIASTLQPTLFKMWQENQIVKQRYPNIEESWQHFDRTRA